MVKLPLKLREYHQVVGVYGRLTGKAGVCLATLGSGATYLVTGFAEANMDRARIVGLAGQGATTSIHRYLNVVLWCGWGWLVSGV
jgi:glyoxylate carboligase